jgi:hypothetical protein
MSLLHYYDLSSLKECDLKRAKFGDNTVVRYEKTNKKQKTKDNTESTYGLCRSIITEKDGSIVSFSPPKSLSPNDFIDKYPDTTQIVATEFVEGTMINVFWDRHIENWVIATRSTIYQETGIYSNKITFHDMFYDAAFENKLILDNLSHCYSYSFVLQHPNNRIVLPILKPQLYLIAIYSFEGNIVSSHDITKFLAFRDTTVKFPAIYQLTSYTDFQERTKTLDYTYLGVVLTNLATGERTKFRNPNYENVRHLKGNQAKLQHQYLVLRKAGNIGEHLRYKPEDKQIFDFFRDQIHSFTQTLRDNYISCYIRKDRPLIEYSDEYRTHMFNLHLIYKNILKPQNQFLMFSNVVSYVNDMDPILLIRSLNYDNKKETAQQPIFSQCGDRVSTAAE